MGRTLVAVYVGIVHQGTYCGAFEWTDPPMFARSCVVIPKLLKKLNVYEKKIEEVELLRAELPKACVVKRTLLLIIAMKMERTFLDAIVELIQLGLAESDKTRVLYDRYLLFSYVIELEDVQYDPITNELNADQAIWDYACERKGAVKAYNNLPDPAWEQLKIIYRDPTPIEVTDDEETNMSNGCSENANQDVISLSPQSGDNSEPEVFWDCWDNTMHAPLAFLEKIVKAIFKSKVMLVRAIPRQEIDGAGASTDQESIHVEDVIDVEEIVEISSDSDEK
ncbi:UNVERIFIED_CONTAM: hypothetical protein Slati_2784900 [Sesamum latifolium]|uniref:HAT C-terminal dimerisation domain-containing protein n=1 Tax=Sesamum latifolium TaxID=2727402 RepID=A0AAW2W1A0_9LAMI